MSKSLPPDMTTQFRDVHDHTKFHAELHIQTLKAGLFDSVYEHSKEKAFNHRERKFLSPHDRWQRQFIPPWPSNSPKPSSIKTSETTARPLIWISGHVSRRNVSWVSSFSVDFVSHFEQFSDFDTAYIFCKRGQGLPYTPTSLIKGLVDQLLDAHPNVAMKNLRELSLARFSRIGSQTKAEAALLAWGLLDDLLRFMSESPALRGRSVLILVDRLDLCVSKNQPSEGFSVLNDLIPRLQGLSHHHTQVQVVITTARLSALHVPTLRRGSDWLRAYSTKAHR